MTKTNKIEIDIDDKNVLPIFYKRFYNLYSLLKDNLIIKDVEVKETKKGFHITLFTNEIDEVEALFIALYLMSDPNRELFNFVRLKKTGKSDKLFFNYKVSSSNYVSEEKLTRKAVEIRKNILNIIKLAKLNALGDLDDNKV